MDDNSPSELGDADQRFGGAASVSPRRSGRILRSSIRLLAASEHNTVPLITKTVQQSSGTCLSRILAFWLSHPRPSDFPCFAR